MPVRTSPLDNLIHRLGGHVDAWLQDEQGKILVHGPVTRGEDYIETTYHVPEGTVFHICWQTRPEQPITALCMTYRPPLPNESEICCATVHFMDSTRPETQQLSSEAITYRGFLSPPAHESGFVQLEISKMTRDNRGRYVIDSPNCLVLRFNLFGVPADPSMLPVSRESPAPAPEDVQIDESPKNDVAFGPMDLVDVFWKAVANALSESGN